MKLWAFFRTHSQLFEAEGEGGICGDMVPIKLRRCQADFSQGNSRIVIFGGGRIVMASIMAF